MKNHLHIKFRKFGLILFWIFASSQMLMAQSASVKGFVYDKQGITLPGVNIVVSGSTFLGTTTDISGAYMLSNVPIGEQSIKVSFLGFESQTKTINVADGQTTELNFTLKQAAISLGEVMVTATRRSTDVQKTAASISAMSGKKLETLGNVSITQFIDAVPGVTSVSNGAGNNRIIFRNVATSTQESGSPMSATYFDDFPISGIYEPGAPDIRLVDMDRVEVLKGPQGTLFGRSAMGGIVRYIPNKASTEKIMSGINTYTSSTTDGGLNYGGHAFLNLPITKNLAIRAVGYTYQNSGFIDNVELNKKDVDGENTWGGRIALHWDVSDAFTVDATYLKQDLKGAFSSVTTTRDPGDPNIVGDEGPEIPFDMNARTAIAGTLMENEMNTDFFNLKLEYDFNYFTATLLATKTKKQRGWIFDEREYINIHAGTLPDENPLSDNPSVEKGSVLELRLVSQKDGFIDWIAGFYYDDTKYHGFQKTTYYGPDQLFYGFFPLTNGIVAIDSEYENTAGEKAFYGEVGFNFSKNSRFLLGYRRSSVESGLSFIKDGGFFPEMTGSWEGESFNTSEDVNTFKLGFEQTFNKDIFGYALVSSGYRPGGFNLPTVISPFSTYNSDKLYNYEMGLKTTWLNGRLRANASAYLLKYNDIQLNVQDPVTFARETKNVGKAQIMGVEFGINYMVSDYLQLGFSGSISNPELLEDVPPTIIDPNGDLNDPNNIMYTGRKGDKLPGSATENFALSASYNKPISDNLNLLADVNYKYVGKRLNDFNTDLDVELGSYSLTNMRIGIDHKNGWSLALFADNVFDKAIIYVIDRQGPTFEMVPTNRPRTIGLNFSYNFK